MTKPVANSNLWNAQWKEKARDLKPWDYLSQVILQVLRKELGEIKGKHIVEGGSGSGRISLRMARQGAHVTLIDYGFEALKLSRSLFLEENCTGSFVQADIFTLPFKDGRFDVVWNAGVMEHYPYKEQGEGLRSLLRICKEDGLVITLNPFSRSVTYRVGKWILEKLGRWPFGEEYAIRTIRDILPDPSLDVVNEYSIGFIVTIVEAYKFVPSHFNSHSMFSYLSNLFARFGPYVVPLDRFLSRIFGGYLLVTVVRKSALT